MLFLVEHSKKYNIVIRRCQIKRDKEKTKEQLINELEEMRQRIAQLEAPEAETPLPVSDEYSRLFELMPMGITIVDMKGVIKSCNSTVYTKSGYSRDDFVGKHFSKVASIRARDIPKYTKVFASLVRGKVPKSFEVTYQRKDGTTGWSELNINLIKVSGERRILAIQHDITERKQTEEALKVSEEKYKSIFEKAPVAIYLLDKDGVIIDVNTFHVEKLGRGKTKPQDYIGRNLIKHPFTIKAGYSKEYAKVLRGEHLELNEVYFPETTGGIPRYFNIRGIPLLKEGEITGAIFIHDDISAYKQVQADLEASKTRYHNLFKDSPVALYEEDWSDVKKYVLNLQNQGVKDLSTHFENNPDDVIKCIRAIKVAGANNAAMKMYKTLTVEQVEDNLHNHFTESTRDAIREAIIAFSEGQVSSQSEAFQTTMRGDKITVLLRSSVPPGFEESLSRVYISVLDITEHKQMEEKVKESEERFRAGVGTLIDGFAIFSAVRDETGHIVDFRYDYINESGCKLNQRTYEEQIGHTLLELLPRHEETGLFDEYVRVVESEQPLARESLFYEDVFGGGRKLNRAFDFQAVKFGDGFAVDWRDITESKQAEEREKQLQQELVLTSRLASVGQMAAGIAHEINNPLTGVVGFAHLLMGRDIPEDIRKDVEVIYDGAQRVASITSRMLTYARQSKSEQTTVDINDIIKTTLAMRTYEMESSNIKVTTQLDPDLPTTTADVAQLQQVFLNIILNAETEMINAHGRGTLSVKTERIDNAIRVSFKDDGPGIAKKNMGMIFDPFFTTREVGQGAGLGLSICHGIISQHRGKIYAQSRFGKGATFIVELPVVTKAEQLELAEPAIQLGKVSKARVLVVDDDTIVQEFLTEILRKEGHEVEIVENGDDALDRLGNEDYDVILLDIKLPGMSGIELYKHLQKTAKSLARRVLFITGDVMSRDTMDFLSKTRVPYITKPFDAELLKKNLNRIISQQS